MKNKKLLIIFLCFVLVILPLKQSLAAWWNPVDWIRGALGWARNNLTGGIAHVFAGIIYWLTYGIHRLLFFINNDLLSEIVNYVSTLNPFADNVNYIDKKTGEKRQAPSPIKVIWDILKNFAYILLVFSALFAAYEWLLGEDATAKRLIFNIIIVALLINFMFVLVKESFLVVDSFEKGITGGESKQIGKLIAASLWQGNPHEEIIKAAGALGNEPVLKSLAEVIGYIFIIVFDMLILIIMVMTTVLFVARYLMIIFLGGTSSIALATLAFPEFKGALGQLFGTFKVWGTWLEYFLRWLLVIPVFVILVILGNVLKENTLGQIGTPPLIEFVMLLFILGGWYVMSMILANKISKGAGNMGKVAATAAMLTVGGLAAKGIMAAVGPGVGNILSRTGESIEQRFAGWGRFGSWVSQRIGKPVKKAGEDMIKRRYGLEAEAVKSRIATIDEQLRKETDPTKQAELTNQLVQLTQRYEKVPYVLEQISESIEKVSRLSFEKIATNKEAITILAGVDAPKELKDKVISQVEKLSKGALKTILGNKDLLTTWANLSPDVTNAFTDKLGKELSDTDVIEQLAKPEITALIPQLPDNFQKTIGRLSKGFVEAAIKKDLDAVSNAMASWSEDMWSQTENIDKALNNYGFTDHEKRALLLDTIRKMRDKSILISAMTREKIDGPIRKIINQLSDDEFNEILNVLNPQQQAQMRAIRSRGIIIATR